MYPSIYDLISGGQIIPKKCESPWAELNREYCFMISTEKETKLDALDWCKDTYGSKAHLLEVYSMQDTMNFIENGLKMEEDEIIDKFDGWIWLGFTAWQRPNGNYTSDITPSKEITFKNFLSGEPGTSAQNCIVIIAGKLNEDDVGKWRDQFCNHKRMISCMILRS